VKAVDSGFRAKLQDWLISIFHSSRNESDRLLIRDAFEVTRFLIFDFGFWIGSAFKGRSLKFGKIF
jgi:hypothetical protein